MYKKVLLLLVVFLPTFSLGDGGEVSINSPQGKVCDDCEDNIHWYQQESLKAQRWKEDPPELPSPLICNKETPKLSCSGNDLRIENELLEFVGLVYVMVYLEVDDRISNPWRFALQRIRKATQTFQRSGVPVQFIVAGIGTRDNGNKSMQGILTDLRGRAGKISRDTGADLVIGLLPEYWGYWQNCGQAVLGVGMAYPMTSVTACYGGTTLEHEIGHSFGLHHDEYQGGQPAVDVGRGYLPSGDRQKGKGTIMAYADKRIPFFSSPKVVVDGIVYGSESVDAVSALNDMLGNVAMAHERYIEQYVETIYELSADGMGVVND